MKTLFVQLLVTEKSMAKISEGLYQFIVPSWANKQQVAKFIRERFQVTVLNVTTATIQRKEVTFRRFPGLQARTKKATVRLKSGESIAEFTLPVEQPASAPSETEPEATPQVPTESTITVRSKSKKSGV